MVKGMWMLSIRTAKANEVRFLFHRAAFEMVFFVVHRTFSSAFGENLLEHIRCLGISGSRNSINMSAWCMLRLRDDNK